MSTQTIDYKRVKCPKCGKSHFRVKDSSGFTTLSFIFKPEPIYKNGKLQNPTELEPIEKNCKCLECGCNFSVNILGKKYEIVDEDKLQEEREKVLADYQKRCEDKIKTDLKDCSVRFASDNSTNGSVTLCNFTHKNDFDEFLKRFDMLEEKVNQLMEKDK